MQDAPTVHQALLATPTPKVATVEAFGTHISYKSQHAKVVADHFGKPCYRKMRRKRKIRRQAALQKACNVICQKKHTSIVAYGDAKFASASKGLAPTPTTAIRRQLGKTCKVVDVDEFRTSMLCCACHRAMPGMPTTAQQPQYRGLSRPPASKLPARNVAHAVWSTRACTAALTKLEPYLKFSPVGLGRSLLQHLSEDHALCLTHCCYRNRHALTLHNCY